MKSEYRGTYGTFSNCSSEALSIPGEEASAADIRKQLYAYIVTAY